jgi:hypothetical protein
MGTPARSCAAPCPMSISPMVTFSTNTVRVSP